MTLNKNHYCTLEQHKKLWELGIDHQALNNPLLRCGDLLDLLPSAITILDNECHLVLQKKHDSWVLYYSGYPEKLTPIPEDWQKPQKSLAQLAADRLIWLLEEKIIEL